MPVAAHPISPAVLHELRAIVGAENIVTGDQELLVYECDAYTLEKSLPNVVVLPRTTAEVVSGWAVAELAVNHTASKRNKNQ